MKIVFWSSMHGQASTANMLAMALAASIGCKKKTLITQSHYNLNNLEVPLIGRIEDKEFYRDIGLDALIRCMKSREITGEIIDSCSVSIIKDKMDLLLGTKQSSRDIFEADISKLMVKIINSGGSFYELVFVDVNSGTGEITMNLLENADVVVVNLRQNEEMLTQYFNTYDRWIMEKLNGRIFYLLGAYDKASKYSLHNLRRRYKRLKSNNSGIVPYSIQFSDCFSDGSLVKHFTRNMNLDEANIEDEFFYHVSKNVSKIIKMAETGA